MDILLDSNIYRSDLSLNSEEISVILDYLARTESRIIMPQVVLDEITELYRKQLTDNINSFISSGHKLKGLLQSSFEPQQLHINIDSEVEKYLKGIKIKLRSVNTISYNGGHLELVSVRAAKRIKPCGGAGQGFRDAVIWLTLLDYADTESEYRHCILISENTSDFANKTKDDLDDHLKRECESRNVKITYFNSLKDFVEKHSVTIKFITSEWVNDHLDFEFIKKASVESINRRRSFLEQIVVRRHRLTPPIGVHALEADNVSVWDHFIYEKQNGDYVVKVDVEMIMSIGIEFMSEGSEPGDNPFHQTMQDWIHFTVEVFLTVADGRVISQGQRDVAVTMADFGSS